MGELEAQQRFEEHKITCHLSAFAAKRTIAALICGHLGFCSATSRLPSPARKPRQRQTLSLMTVPRSRQRLQTLYPDRPRSHFHFFHASDRLKPAAFKKDSSSHRKRGQQLELVRPQRRPPWR